MLVPFDCSNPGVISVWRDRKDDKVIKGISLKAITNCRQVDLAPNGRSIHGQRLMICLSS